MRMIRQQLRSGWRRAAGSGRWRRLLGNRRAGVAVITAISFPLLLGFVGLASEAGLWLVIKRSMQGAADAAAFSGSVAKYEGASPARVCSEALAVAAQNGYPSADPSCNATGSACATQTCVLVNNPPTSGGNTATTDAVEVIIKQPQTASIAGFISGFYRLGAPNIAVAARAVAAASQPGDCVLALDTNTADNGMLSDGNSNAVLGCGFADNASLQMNGTGATINATGGAVRGTVNPGTGSLTPANPAVLSSPVTDPYADNIPSNACASCTNHCGAGTTLTQGGAVPAGVYCCGLKLTGPPAVPNTVTAFEKNTAAAAGQNQLSIDSSLTGVNAGMLAIDTTNPSAIPGNTTVTHHSGGSGSVTLSNNLTYTVAVNDAVLFQTANQANTSAATAAGGTQLSFAGQILSTDPNLANGQYVLDLTNPQAIPGGTKVASFSNAGGSTGTSTVTMTAAVQTGFSVGVGDTIEFENSTAYTMSGTYTICGGTFYVDGNASINASNSNAVTILLTGNATTNYANATMAGGSTINLTAPTSGSFAGLVFYQDPAAGSSTPATQQSKILGGSSTTITGAIDFGSTNLLYNGNSSSTTPCTQIIGWNIEFKGTSNIQDQCNGTGVKPIKAVALVE